MEKRIKNKPMKVVKKDPKPINHEIIGVIICAIGFILSLGIYSNGDAIVLKATKDFLGGLFGMIIYIIPVIFVVYGILVMFEKTEFAIKKKVILLVILFILIAGLVHTYVYDFTKLPTIFNPKSSTQEGIDYDRLTRELYDLGGQKQGGGLLGGLISLWVFNLMGFYGSLIVFGTAIIIIVLYMTNLSFVKFILGIKRSIIWIAKITNRTILYLKEKLKSSPQSEEKLKIEDSKKIVKEKFDLKLESKFLKIDKVKNIKDKVIEELKNIVPEKIISENKSYEQQEIKINLAEDTEEEKAKMQANKNQKIANTPELLEINVSSDSKIEKNYKLPTVNLLNATIKSEKPRGNKKEILEKAKKLEHTLSSFGVEAKVVEINRGPTVTRYELAPSAGVKVSKIVNLADDIALNLAASGIRIEAPIPGKAAVGIEVPNKEVSPVFLSEIIDTDKFRSFESKLAFVLGKDVGGEPVITDIAKMPHLLIAGATGSGKSVCINTLITSILYKANPNEVKLLMIDPKVVELGVYNEIPHLLIPVVTDAKKAAGALNWAVQEMVLRYQKFADSGVRDLTGYNAISNSPEEKMPQIVIIIDELADLMMVAANNVEDAICRLAQMARAAGMHLVIATQRPSVDVITGIIKANIPSRVSFAVTSQVDSRTILDMGGAEKLLGRGDMLFYPVGESKPRRIQGAFISDKEVENVINFIKDQYKAEYSEDIIEKIYTEKEVEINPGDNDDFLNEAIEIVIESEHASISMLQRRLRVGYARAARLIDQMEARGIVGGFEGSKPRQVLISKEQYYSQGFQG